MVALQLESAPSYSGTYGALVLDAITVTLLPFLTRYRYGEAYCQAVRRQQQGLAQRGVLRQPHLWYDLRGGG